MNTDKLMELLAECLEGLNATAHGPVLEGSLRDRITRALGTTRPNDLDAVVAQRDALAGKLAWLEESVRNAGCEIDYSATQGEGGEDCVWNRRAEDAETARQSEGMVLVPREPTSEMVLAGAFMHDVQAYGLSEVANIYKDMLAAAPGGEGEG